MQLNIAFTPHSIEIAILILIGVLIVFLLVLLLLYRRFPVHLIYKSKIGFESMLDAVNEPLAVISDDFTVRRVNKAYVNMVGSTYKASINAKCYKLLRGRGSPCEDCRLKEALAEAATLEVELSAHPRGAGSINLTFSPYAMPIGGKTAEICVIEHLRDITALEKLRISLEQRNRFLDSLTRKLRSAQRSVKAELRVARQIQLGLFPPELPKLERMRFDMTYKPVADVGGDIYDFISMDGNRLGVFIGDASGHGLASSLIGTLSKMSLYNHGDKPEAASTSALLEHINRDLKAHIHTSHYLTCFWCIIDFNENKMTYSRAGHPAQLVLRKDGTLHQLTGNGIFLGITEDAAYDENEFKFEAGDRIYWFTDGIYDVFRKDREKSDDREDFLGYYKFTELVKETAGAPFEEIIGRLKEKLTVYKFEDDYTLIVAEIS